MEGTAAISLFHACPNNDGGSSLPLSARIKLVVKDAAGAPIVGIAPTDMCVLFNGGTPAQGFSGPGADSVIANGQYNTTPLCPNVQCIPADASTDANGVAYITFTGPGGVRDPNRKWGHYDSELPVYVQGIKIPGRLTSSPGSGPYVLQIKNFDSTGGLGTALNQGETVTSADLNAIANNMGVNNALSYWRDFNSDGVVSLTDLNMVSCHVTHDCDTPFNP
jgi:hypothetical protein